MDLRHVNETIHITLLHEIIFPVIVTTHRLVAGITRLVDVTTSSHEVIQSLTCLLADMLLRGTTCSSELQRLFLSHLCFNFLLGIIVLWHFGCSICHAVSDMPFSMPASRTFFTWYRISSDRSRVSNTSQGSGCICSNTSQVSNRSQGLMANTIELMVL